MTNLTTAAAGLPACQHPPSRPATAQQVGKALRDIHAMHLVLFDDWDALRRAHRRDNLDALGRECRDNPIRTDHVWLERQRIEVLRDARARLASLPSGDVMKAMRDRIMAAARAPYDRGQARILIGLLVDSFHTMRAHDPVTYLEALFHEVEVEQYPPAVIAKACSAIKRSATFPPSVAELIEACSAQGGTLASAQGVLTWLIDGRDNAESAQAALEAMCEITPEFTEKMLEEAQLRHRAKHGEPATKEDSKSQSFSPPP